MKLLVVDDEESLCEILQFNLEVEGYDVDVAYSAEQALEMDLSQYSLILLDVMMGTMSGFKMAQIIKKNPAIANIPIIFCTAKDTEDDTVAGLTLGADDYISKPFSVREVVARVKTVLRRVSSAVAAGQNNPASNASMQGAGTSVQQGNAAMPVGTSSGSGQTETMQPGNNSRQERIIFEGLIVDLLKMKCFVDGNEVPLTKTEMGILIVFLNNRGRVLSREEILRKVWSDDVIVLDRTIDVNITRLRKKIGKYGQNIITRQGYGYGFEV